MNYKQRGAVLFLQKRKTSLTAARWGRVGAFCIPKPQHSQLYTLFQTEETTAEASRLKARLALSSHTYMGNSCTQMIPSYIAAWG